MKPYIKILNSSYRCYTIHLETGIVQDEEFKFAVEKKTWIVADSHLMGKIFRMIRMIFRMIRMMQCLVYN